MLFRLTEVKKSYGAQEVLRDVTFQVNPSERIGLVGRNGAGKTTIIRLITGAETADVGEIERLRSLKTGILDQHIDFFNEITLIEAALEVFERLRRLEEKMRELEHAMTDTSGDALEQVMHEYSDAQHAYELEGGFSYRARAESVLLGLGFSKDDFDQKAATLSGGEKNRLGLARLLLLEPDILLLDEPTNHLDVEAVEWLEEFLGGYKSAYLIISHDRFFLDNTVTRILDLENGRVDSYKGNYSQYIEQKEERREFQQKAFEQQQELISRAEEFIRRNLAGQKTKMAKSRRNMLERMERLEDVSNQSTASFRLKRAVRTGDEVLVLEKLAIGYPRQIFARDVSLLLRRRERLGIIGGNGTGKTTLLRTILGRHKQVSGEFRWGTGVSIGYYDQRLLSITDGNSVIDELRTAASALVTDGELRSFLGRFLFSGDDVFKEVSSLSGGEKGRLAIAKLIYAGANVLILDEPTNHLDIASREALENALNDFDGTVITVSHDRYFLDRIATQILHFGDGNAEHYQGGYSEFHDHRLRLKAEMQAEEARVQQVERASKKAERERVANARKNKPKQPDPALIEDEIHAIETQLKEVTELLSLDEVVRDKDRLIELGNRYQELEEKLKGLYDEWETAHETAQD